MEKKKVQFSMATEAPEQATTSASIILQSGEKQFSSGNNKTTTTAARKSQEVEHPEVGKEVRNVIERVNPPGPKPMKIFLANNSPSSSSVGVTSSSSNLNSPNPAVITAKYSVVTTAFPSATQKRNENYARPKTEEEQEATKISQSKSVSGGSKKENSRFSSNRAVADEFSEENPFFQEQVALTLSQKTKTEMKNKMTDGSSKGGDSQNDDEERKNAFKKLVGGEVVSGDISLNLIPSDFDRLAELQEKQQQQQQQQGQQKVGLLNEKISLYLKFLRSVVSAHRRMALQSLLQELTVDDHDEVPNNVRTSESAKNRENEQQSEIRRFREALLSHENAGQYLFFIVRCVMDPVFSLSTLAMKIIYHCSYSERDLMFSLELAMTQGPPAVFRNEGDEDEEADRGDSSLQQHHGRRPFTFFQISSTLQQQKSVPMALTQSGFLSIIQTRFPIAYDWEMLSMVVLCDKALGEFEFFSPLSMGETAGCNRGRRVGGKRSELLCNVLKYAKDTLQQLIVVEGLDLTTAIREGGGRAERSTTENKNGKNSSSSSISMTSSNPPSSGQRRKNTKLFHVLFVLHRLVGHSRRMCLEIVMEIREYLQLLMRELLDRISQQYRFQAASQVRGEQKEENKNKNADREEGETALQLLQLCFLILRTAVAAGASRILEEFGSFVLEAAPMCCAASLLFLEMLILQQHRPKAALQQVVGVVTTPLTQQLKLFVVTEITQLAFVNNNKQQQNDNINPILNSNCCGSKKDKEDEQRRFQIAASALHCLSTWLLCAGPSAFTWGSSVPETLQILENVLTKGCLTSLLLENSFAMVRQWQDDGEGGGESSSLSPSFHLLSSLQRSGYCAAALRFAISTATVRAELMTQVCNFGIILSEKLRPIMVQNSEEWKGGTHYNNEERENKMRKAEADLTTEDSAKQILQQLCKNKSEEVIEQVREEEEKNASHVREDAKLEKQEGSQSIEATTGKTNEEKREEYSLSPILQTKKEFIECIFVEFCALIELVEFLALQTAKENNCVKKQTSTSAMSVTNDEKIALSREKKEQMLLTTQKLFTKTAAFKCAMIAVTLGKSYQFWHLDDDHDSDCGLRTLLTVICNRTIYPSLNAYFQKKLPSESLQAQRPWMYAPCVQQREADVVVAYEWASWLLNQCFNHPTIVEKESINPAQLLMLALYCYLLYSHNDESEKTRNSNRRDAIYLETFHKLICFAVELLFVSDPPGGNGTSIPFKAHQDPCSNIAIQHSSNASIIEKKNATEGDQNVPTKNPISSSGKKGWELHSYHWSLFTSAFEACDTIMDSPYFILGLLALGTCWKCAVQTQISILQLICSNPPFVRFLSALHSLFDDDRKEEEELQKKDSEITPSTNAPVHSTSSFTLPSPKTFLLLLLQDHQENWISTSAKAFYWRPSQVIEILDLVQPFAHENEEEQWMEGEENPDHDGCNKSFVLHYVHHVHQMGLRLFTGFDRELMADYPVPSDIPNNNHNNDGGALSFLHEGIHVTTMKQWLGIKAKF